MSLLDFMSFYQAIVNIMGQAWNLLQSLQIAGIGLGSWSLGFFLFGVVIRIFFKVTSGSTGSVAASGVEAYRDRDRQVVRKIGF